MNEGLYPYQLHINTFFVSVDPTSHVYSTWWWYRPYLSTTRDRNLHKTIKSCGQKQSNRKQRHFVNKCPTPPQVRPYEAHLWRYAVKAVITADFTWIRCLIKEHLWINEKAFCLMCRLRTSCAHSKQNRFRSIWRHRYQNACCRPIVVFIHPLYNKPIHCLTMRILSESEDVLQAKQSVM